MAKGQRIRFVDTCHSGNAYNRRLDNAACHPNIVADLDGHPLEAVGVKLPSQGPPFGRA